MEGDGIVDLKLESLSALEAEDGIFTCGKEGNLESIQKLVEQGENLFSGIYGAVVGGKSLILAHYEREDFAVVEKLIQDEKFESLLQLLETKPDDRFYQWAQARMLLDGVEGVLGKDRERSLELFERTALQGFVMSQFGLGFYHYNRQDFVVAFSWFLKAAKQGHPGSQYNLGVMLQYGQGIASDYQTAMKWYRKAVRVVFLFLYLSLLTLVLGLSRARRGNLYYRSSIYSCHSFCCC